MPIITGPAGMDPVLGEMRTIDISGGTGGGDYTFNTSEFTVSVTGLVSLKNIPVSKVDGAVTGIDASVSGGTATITATGSTTSVKFTGTGGVDVKGNTTTGDIELDIHDVADGTQSVSKDVKNAMDIPDSSTQNALTLLHFSDIHADSGALGRIMADKSALGNLVSDAICTGDMVETTYGSISSWWIPSVLTVIGNHDVKVGSSTNALSMAERDSLYIAPFEANWGVVHTSGTSYYYKDYSTQKVRLIVLDNQLCMGSSYTAEAAAMLSWLADLLAGAITGNLHVLIALHAPTANAASLKCSFSRFDGTVPRYSVYSVTSASITDVVAAAISNGLQFVGYICGHEHQDGIWDATGDGTQLMYAVTLACTVGAKGTGHTSDQYRDASGNFDAFNLVTIDTTHTLVKLVRGGGANIDNRMRPRQAISINYSTGEIIDYETDSTRYEPVFAVSGSTVTLRAGRSYQFTATDAVTLVAETMPEDSYGQRGALDIDINGGTVLTGTNVVLADPLTADKRNVCTVEFIDELAVVKVLTVLTHIPADAYTVTIATGTGEGSLYYGLATSDKTDIYIGRSLNYQTLDLGGVTTSAGPKNVIGNGYTKTIVSGGITCTSDTTFSNLGMNGVVISSGETPFFTDVFIDSGATVSAFTGDVSVENITGNNGVIDLTNGGHVVIGSSATITGVSVINGSSTNGGLVYVGSSALAVFTDVQFTHGEVASNGAGLFIGNTASARMTSCAVASCGIATMPISGGGVLLATKARSTLSACEIYSNKVTSLGGGIYCNASGVHEFTSCYIHDNTNKGISGGGIAQMSATTCTYVDCVIVNNSPNDIDTGWGAVIVRGGTVGTISLDHGAPLTLDGTVSIGSVIPRNVSSATRQGTVTISSGAIVSLTGSIAPASTAQITVLTGGCVVNGATIAEGTYTSIVSSGGSAVAS